MEPTLLTLLASLPESAAETAELTTAQALVAAGRTVTPGPDGAERLVLLRHGGVSLGELQEGRDRLKLRFSINADQQLTMEGEDLATNTSLPPRNLGIVE